MKSATKLAWLIGLALSITSGSWVLAQKPPKRVQRASPPKLPASESSGVFYPDPIAQLQGTPADASKMADEAVSVNELAEATPAQGADVWKQLIAGGTIEDLVKESKARLDSVVTTPAKFASGGYLDCRNESALLAALMTIISQYPDEVRWKASAPYARAIFARLAANCKVGTQPVFNEAKQRQLDLQDLLKGSTLKGTAEDLVWREVTDRKLLMVLLEWLLRKNLAPSASSQEAFRENKEDLAKYAELVAAFGHILQQDGMPDADSEEYTEVSRAMTAASRDVLKAIQADDAELARTAVGRIDQACNKCHETYKP